jgi:CheY-like chemotaxis protein
MASILIIDDDPAIQNIFTQFLEAVGHRVQTASNGKDALALMKTEAPDLVITDIMMPEMDGLELVTHLRDSLPDLPVIAISGGMKTSPMNFLPLAKRFGACKVLEKPVSMKDLLANVEELLANGSN